MHEFGWHHGGLIRSADVGCEGVAPLIFCRQYGVPVLASCVEWVVGIAALIPVFREIHVVTIAIDHISCWCCAPLLLGACARERNGDVDFSADGDTCMLVGRCEHLVFDVVACQRHTFCECEHKPHTGERLVELHLHRAGEDMLTSLSVVAEPQVCQVRSFFLIAGICCDAQCGVRRLVVVGDKYLIVVERLVCRVAVRCILNRVLHGGVGI